jgi:hypothetical protein
MHNFDILDLPEQIKASMIKAGVWSQSCPVSLDRLKLLRISYYDFAGDIKEGQMVVLDKLASNVIEIFKELLNIKFPIDKMNLLDKYQGSDELSMEDNNSSCFNHRFIANSKILSMHSLGLAIDINPVQNPYIIINEQAKSVQVLPEMGLNYLNRNNQRPGMVEPIVGIFKKYGYDVWGGNWDSPIDYHHFQVNRNKIDAYI